jgi:hypothetical protein
MGLTPVGKSKGKTHEIELALLAQPAASYRELARSLGVSPSHVHGVAKCCGLAAVRSAQRRLRLFSEALAALSDPRLCRLVLWLRALDLPFEYLRRRRDRPELLWNALFVERR